MTDRKDQIEFILPSDFKFLGAVDAAVQDLAREMSCEQRWINDFSTALVEACSNAIENGPGGLALFDGLFILQDDRRFLARPVGPPAATLADEVDGEGALGQQPVYFVDIVGLQVGQPLVG